MEKDGKMKASVTAGVVILLVWCMSAVGFHAISYSGGTGEPNDPYLIKTVADWQRLMSEPNDWGKHFLMAANIDMDGVAMTPVGADTSTSFGFQGTQFTGVFDGGGYVISNVDINEMNKDNVGVFGYLGAGGQIKNLEAKNVNIAGRVNVGGLVGYISSSSIYRYNVSLEHCYVTGAVCAYRTDPRFGVQLYNYAGGLVGYNNTGIIKGSYASCSVRGISYLGGLAGYNSSGNITNCYAMGSVSGGSPTGNGATNIGGFVGYTASGVISNCYAQGTVNVSGANFSNIGGFVGYSNTTIRKSFWDTETSGQSVGVGSGSLLEVYGKTTAEMKTVATFAEKEWHISDFNGFDGDWIIMHDGQDYPKISHLVYFDNSLSVPFAGDGNETSPYEIWTAEDFIALGHCYNTWEKHICLMADIDLSGLLVHPIGNSIRRFTGNFDGQGFVIANAGMNFPNKDYVGLFGSVGTNGAVSNLGAKDVNIVGRKYAGGVVGHSLRGTISNCHSSGTVSVVGNSSYAGGLAGLIFEGQISECYSNAKVSGSGTTAGGLVGVNLKGTISNCKAEGNIECSDLNNIGSFAGGLTGSNFGTILNSYASGKVDLISDFSLSTAVASAGGLAGDNCGTILNSFAKGNVFTNSASPSSTACLGGLVGLKSDGDVNNCYSDVNIACDSNSNYFAGGLVGMNFESAVASSYSRGAVDVNAAYSGGFAGLNLGGWIFECFWDTESSGKITSAGGIGLDSEQMKTMSIYQDAGWAGKGWVIRDGKDYPRLEWEGTGGTAIPESTAIGISGSGTAEDPYQVWTAEEFALLSGYDLILDKHIRLMADLDMDGFEIYPIGGLEPFVGTFDGNGHTLRNVRINQAANSYVGLFAQVGAGALISDLGLKDCDIIGGDYVGGLIGKNAGGIVSGCFASGYIGGYSYVGGLIASNDGGNVNNCYTSGQVDVWDTNSSYSYAGGFIGDCNSGSILNCYSSSLVMGDGNFIGGLAGHNESSTFSSCFWDMETSGRETNSGGIGLGMEQMKTMTTYQNAGWCDYGWVINDGIDYPRLDWEGTSGIAIPADSVPLLGSGTEVAPYQIWTAEDFALLSEHVVILDKHIRLMADIDLAGVDIKPIGNRELAAFAGNFDGNGHAIRNAVINLSGSDYVGLFGYVSGGQFHNLSVIDANIVGHNYVSGIAGYNKNGIITSCGISGTINGYSYVGGLAGYDSNGVITKCRSVSTISGDSYIGGVVGYKNGSSSLFEKCYAGGTVNCFSDYGGGLVGYNNLGTVALSYSDCNIDGTKTIGGAVGYTNGTVISCYASGNVYGSSYGAGGLVGNNYKGKVIRCYSTCKFNNYNARGFCDDITTGGNYEDTGNFWDVEITELTYSSMGTKKTTAEMKTKSTFTDAGWDFENTWAICEGTSYPKLLWSIPSGELACPYGVDFTDYTFLAGRWLETDCAANNNCGGADLDHSGTVDWKDLKILGESWLEGVSL